MNGSQEAEDRHLQTSFMGDIREDIQYLGLTMADIGWIFAATLFIGGGPFLFPLGILLKLAWLVLVLAVSVTARYVQWPYRFQRWYRYVRGNPTGTGRELPSWLGITPNGWLVQSGPVWHMAIRIQAPPWQTATWNQKRQRIQGFEWFIRACMNERVEVALSSELLPDYRWEIWDAKAKQASFSEGLSQLTNSRLKRWQQQASSREAQRSEYTLRLSVHEKELKRFEREGEPEGASKEELQRYRTLADLREMKELVLAALEASGHSCTLGSGYTIAEWLARQWDPFTWSAWKSVQGDWEEEHPELIDEEAKQGLGQRARRFAYPRNTVGRKLRLKRMMLRVRARFRRAGRKTGSLWLRLRNLWQPPRTFTPEQEPCPDSVPSSIALRAEQPVATDNGPPCGWVPMVLFTSPAPTGKTFVAANLAVANASPAFPIVLIDLSPGQGCLTIVNPVQSEQIGRWRVYTSRIAPGLTVGVPDLDLGTPRLGEMVDYILGQSAYQRVVVDLPWHYPDRQALLDLGFSIAVIDSDYHHWTQWERATGHWAGEVWQNQDEVEMQPLVLGHFGCNIARRIPTFPAARQRLFQGRPLAQDPELKAMLIWPAKKEGGPC
jgi:hypothetical protein